MVTCTTPPFRAAVRLNSGVMHVETVALSSYSKFLKGFIVGGIAFFFALGAMCIWLAATDSPTRAAQVIFIVMAAGFVGFAWFGLRLLPFLHVSCAATPEGLYIFDRHLEKTFLPWSSVGRVKDWQALQVIDLYDTSGNRVLSIDYYISNFEPFYAQLLESAPASA